MVKRNYVFTFLFLLNFESQSSPRLGVVENVELDFFKRSGVGLRRLLVIEQSGLVVAVIDLVFVHRDRNDLVLNETLGYAPFFETISVDESCAALKGLESNRRVISISDQGGALNEEPEIGLKLFSGDNSIVVRVHLVELLGNVLGDGHFKPRP